MNNRLSQSMPDTVSVIEIAGPGGPEMLRPAIRPLARPGPGEVLIEVAAAGINRPDILQRQGHYPPPKGASDIPGLEVAGRIAALGDSVENWQVGERVCALVTGGGYAHYCLAPAGQCLKVPEGLSLVEAAGLPETVCTVWANLFATMGLQEPGGKGAGLTAGESLLVHGGSSGIGSTAIQIARARGITVYATAGTPEKCAFCEKLGAARAIDYRQQDFVDILKEETAGKGVDAILDMVGGDYIPRNIAALAPGGRLVFIAFLGGSKANLNFLPVMTKRLTITGSTLRPRGVADKSAIVRAVEEEVWPLLAAGKMRPVIHAVFPLAEAAKAHALLEAGTHMGKIILEI